jgi:hypothetical protein
MHSLFSAITTVKKHIETDCVDEAVRASRIWHTGKAHLGCKAAALKSYANFIDMMQTHRELSTYR